MIWLLAIAVYAALFFGVAWVLDVRTSPIRRAKGLQDGEKDA